MIPLTHQRMMRNDGSRLLGSVSVCVLGSVSVCVLGSVSVCVLGSVPRVSSIQLPSSSFSPTQPYPPTSVSDGKASKLAGRAVRVLAAFNEWLHQPMAVQCTAWHMLALV